MNTSCRFLGASLLACCLLAASLRAESGEFYQDVTALDFLQRKDVQQNIDPAAPRWDLLAAAIFHRSNAVRTTHSLPAFVYNRSVAAAAQAHSKGLAKHGALSHGTPYLKENLMPWDRLLKVGLQPQFSAENVAYNFLLRYEAGTPVYTRKEKGVPVLSLEPDGESLKPHSYASFAEVIVEQWMQSPPHRKNLLSTEATQLGAGCALANSDNGLQQIYCTLMFFAPLPL